MTAPPSSEIDVLVENVRSGLETVRRLVNDIITGINSVLDQLPEPVIAEIRTAVADLQRLANEHITEVQRFVALAGSPDTLRITGASWREVGALVSAQAGKATLNSTRSDNQWTGKAADAYWHNLLVQEKALVAVRARTEEIDNVLQEMASAINDFWTGIGVAVVALTTGLASAAISASGVVSAPAAPVFAAGAFLAFGTAAGSAMVAFTNITNECAVRAEEFKQSIDNNDAFTNGKWPSSATPDPSDAPTATDFSDASLTDGDDSDWHIR